MLSKEHAIVLPALLLAAEVLIQGGERRISERLRNNAVTFVSLITLAAGFVIARTSVTGGMRAAGINEILSGEPFSVRAFTMLNVVVEWIRLLFWPSQLSADYSFPRTRVATSFEPGMLPAVVIIVGCAAIAWRVRKSMPAVTFAILWFAVTMAIPSNLIMVTGFVLAERTLFLPSAAVVLVAGGAIAGAWTYIGEGEPVRRGLLAAAVGIVMVCGVVRSAARNPAWRDNETLFRQTVEDVPFSARAHWMLSEHFAKTNRRGPAAEEMMLAVALGRKDDFILLGFAADQFNVAGMCPRAMPLYRRALALTPQNEQLRANASLCLMKLGRIEEARALASAGFDRNRSSKALIRSVAIADSLTRLSRTHMAQ